MKLKTRDIVYIGFIAALCAVATTIRIEIPGGAMVHLGSAALFSSSHYRCYLDCLWLLHCLVVCS